VDQMTSTAEMAGTGTAKVTTGGTAVIKNATTAAAASGVMDCYNTSSSDTTCRSTQGKCYIGYDIMSPMTVTYSCTAPYGATPTACVGPSGSSYQTNQCIFCCTTDRCNKAKTLLIVIGDCALLKAAAPGQATPTFLVTWGVVGVALLLVGSA
jgi:hypothetical protein